VSRAAGGASVEPSWRSVCSGSPLDLPLHGSSDVGAVEHIDLSIKIQSWSDGIDWTNVSLIFTLEQFHSNSTSSPPPHAKRARMSASPPSSSDGEWVALKAWAFPPLLKSVRSEIVLIDLATISGYVEHSGDPELRVVVSSNASVGESIAFALTVSELGNIGNYELLLAGITLVAAAALLLVPRLHRVHAVTIASWLALLWLAVLHRTPTMAELWRWIDASTLGLHMGMALLAALFAEAGAFEWAAVQAYGWSKGSLRRLAVLLAALAALCSAFLDGAMALLLIIPVTAHLCQLLDLRPVPLIFLQLFLSNIGAAATQIGGHPNIILGSALSSYVDFLDFVTVMLPGSILCGALALGLLLWRERAELSGVRQRDLGTLANVHALKRPRLFYAACAVLIAVLALLFLAPLTKLDAPLAALLGGTLLLAVAKAEEPDKLLAHLEWESMLFLAVLFVLVGALERMRLLAVVARALVSLLLGVDGTQARLAVAIVLLLWGTAIVSAIIHNVTFVATLAPVIEAVAVGSHLPVRPLVWSVAFGAALGGNLSPLAAGANIVVLGYLREQGHDLTVAQFLRRALPIALPTLVLATAYLLIIFVAAGAT